MSPPLLALPDATPRQASRLLIIDDDATRAWALARELRGTATILRAAVASIEDATRLAPDAVLAAFELIAADALAFVDALGRLAEAPPIPVLVLADGDARDQRLQALRAGAADCFDWPIDHDELVARVAAQLQQSQRTRRLWAASYRDPLTGLLNRRGLQDVLARDVERAARRNEPLALLFVDLDGFKQVNDRHGHEVGDALLRHVANLLTRSVRTGDAVARLGGDEFVVVLPRRDAAGARSLARRLEQHLACQTSRLALGASVGIATLDHPTDRAELLLARADRAMYARKQARTR